MTGSAIAWLAAAAFFVGMILCEELLQRRTGQSWWAIHQLGWAAINGALAVLLAYIFLIGAVGLWSLLERWGLSWVSAGAVTYVIAFLAFRAFRRGSSGRHVEPALVGDRDQHARGVVAEREFHVTLTGRPARLLGRLLHRLVRTSDDRSG